MMILEWVFASESLLASSPTLDELIETERHFNEVLKAYWVAENYLTFNWWVLILLSIVPAVIWWKFVDKSRIFEIVTFGLFLGNIAIILDSIGSTALVWYYPVRISPYLFPQLYPFDISLVIIPFMFVYQWARDNDTKFYVYTVLVSAFNSYFAEAVTIWIGIYKEFTWTSSKSFFIYIALGILCRLIIKFMKRAALKD
jgi:hypothetical protein